MEQALERDRLLLIRSEFAGGPDMPQLNWTLLLVPSRGRAGGAGRLAGRAGIAARRREGGVGRADIPRDRLAGIRRGRLRGDRAMGRRRGAARIRTLLGSCVGVVLYDRTSKLGGLAHVVLPSARGPVDHPGKYADTAIPAVIAELERRLGPRTRTRLTAKLVGGASMFQVDTPAESTLNIGRRNQEAIEAILDDAADPRPGPRPGRHDRTPLDPGHRFGHRRHQGTRGRRL